jgi:hypothetical protein
MNSTAAGSSDIFRYRYQPELKLQQNKIKS